MRLILVLLLFFNYIFAQTYVLQENLTRESLVNFTKYLEIPTSIFSTPKEVLESKKLLNLADADIEFNVNNSIWTVVEIKNPLPTQKTVYMVNFFVLTELINAYIYENNQLIETFDFGSTVENLQGGMRIPLLR